MRRSGSFRVVPTRETWPVQMLERPISALLFGSAKRSESGKSKGKSIKSAENPKAGQYLLQCARRAMGGRRRGVPSSALALGLMCHKHSLAVSAKLTLSEQCAD